MQTYKTINLRSLNPSVAFDGLTANEKLYAYYMSEASWYGSHIVSKQVSPESHQLINAYVNAFNDVSISDTRTKLNAMFGSEDTDAYLNYVALVFGNMGNYTSFGDTKFIPRISQDIFVSISIFLELDVNLDINKLYDLTTKRLDYYPDGVTCYTSSNVTKDDVMYINKLMTDNKLEHWNTRITKQDDIFTIHVASVDNNSYKLCDNVIVQHGDYSEILEHVVENLERAKKYIANNIQEKMLECYIDHFVSGNTSDHRKAQIEWVQDKGPVVETNMGFVENYRDPSGVRAEFESFVAIVDKETSKKFKRLVDNAQKFIDMLPWPKTMENDEFMSPDFTSLDVITFASSGVPAGINIPNYHDIKSDYGFKNVSLGNIIRSAYNSPEPTQFLTADDDILFKKYSVDAFEIGVGSHELIGHGTGKLIIKGRTDLNIIDPLTDNFIQSWYKPYENFYAKFGAMSSAYEECRAESVSLLLSTVDDIYDIFEFYDINDRENLMYISWLTMVRSGLASCFAYDIENDRWTQAHSQARYVIYRVLNEIPNFITINKSDNTFTVELDRTMIRTHGLDAINLFLLKLQVYKSTGNFIDAKEMFDGYSNVDQDIHTIVIETRRPRAIIIQPTMYLEDDNIIMKTYPETVDGMIESLVDKLGK